MNQTKRCNMASKFDKLRSKPLKVKKGVQTKADMIERMHFFIEVVRQYERDFAAMFKGDARNLKHYFGFERGSEFIDRFLGFNVVSFSDDIKVPDNESTRDYVKKKYGSSAVSMIEDLMSIRKEAIK